ncbi:dTDP-glucose 4,6-dehydratase isoform X3 [Octopus sinensis]|uniref:dTDP-glucose 4,6-dehydratase isoform X3 n=1 Tax=Octopus sinensis TaxID=2607531 RepID=A0A6P7T2H7_9MOLL|nr:dTDP-glucose 4,6-dehydratase isoform X3 [Octopus sinensis]
MTNMADGGRRARVLILGGTGFIGRNLVSYLVNNELVTKVRVADKVPPQMAWLNSKHKEAFANPLVEFKHSNLINIASVESAFADVEGPFDFAINLAAETKYGQTDPVYQEGIVKLSLNCAREAAKRNVKIYIEASSSQMYSADKPEDEEMAATEEKKCDPWTFVAKHKLSVEKELKSIPDLNVVIVRPAIVYGPGDRQGLTPRLIIGAIYKYMRETMKMLWTKELKMNTVHVEDMCRALWFLCNHGKTGEIYHIVDKGDTTQGKISELISTIFNIEHEFVGSTMSSLAKLNMNSIVEEINDKHMEPWADACQRDNVTNTPLNPFIDQELLYNKHLHLSGSKLESLGFSCQKPELTIDYMKEVLEDYLHTRLFPPSLLSDQKLWSKPIEEEDAEDSGQ